MKQPLFLLCAFLLCAGATFHVPSTSQQFRLTAVGDRLAFQSIADYRKVVDQPDADLKATFLKTAASLGGFCSLKASPSSTDGPAALIHDDYFKSILNPDLVVQIGEDIFRVNPQKQRVFVLKATLPDQYPDLLAENEANPNIRVFSTGQNVLDLIENPALSTATENQFCKESGIGGYDRATGLLPVSGNLGMEGKLHFNRFGIYYSLFAEVGTAQSGTLELLIDLEPVQYHARCGVTNGPYNVYNYRSNSSPTFNYQKYQSYQGSKNLNKVNFRGRFKAKIGGNVVKESHWIQIKVNY